MESVFQFLAIALVFSLLGAAVWLLKRQDLPGLTRKKAGRRIEHIETASLTQQHSVHLLRFAHRAILVSTQPSGCTLLGNYAWDEVEPKESA